MQLQSIADCLSGFEADDVLVAGHCDVLHNQRVDILQSARHAAAAGRDCALDTAGHGRGA